MAINHKPYIGITGPDKGGSVAWLFTALSVLWAGGIPIRITPSRPHPYGELNALIVGGGADVDPEAYEDEDFINEYLDQTLKNKRKSFFKRIFSFINLLIYPLIFLIRRLFSRKSSPLDKERDQLEFHLVDKAIKQKIPVLGICRGAQLINVYFKGDLYQDIKSFYQEEPNRASIFPVKKVFLKANSQLASVLQVDRLRVNALHSQAVKEAGEGIQIVAHEANGVVQAIESTIYNFVIGVQWHPEYLIHKKVHRRIFSTLVDRANFVSRSAATAPAMAYQKP